MLAKKTQKNQMSFGSHNVNEDMFGFQDEDDEDPEVTSKMGGKDVSSGGSNVGGSGASGSCLKDILLLDENYRLFSEIYNFYLY